MMEALFDRIACVLKKGGIFSRLRAGENLDIKELNGSLKAIFISLIQSELSRPVCVVLPQDEDAENLNDDLNDLFSENQVAYFPAGQENPSAPVPLSVHRDGQQMAVLRDIAENELSIIVTDIQGLLQLLPDPLQMKEERIEISVNDNCDLYTLVEKLVHFGYARESLVERPGEISLRGGILDIFPFTGEAPHRVEFMGNQIESIRLFDVETQRSSQKVNQLILVSSPLTWKERSATLLSYLNKNALLFVQDPDFLKAELDSFLSADLPVENIRKELSGFQRINYWSLSNPANAFQMGARPVPALGKSSSDISKGLNLISKNGTDIFITYHEDVHKKRLIDLLNLVESPIKNLRFIEGQLSEGFLFPDVNCCVITHHELWGRTVKKRRRRKFQESVPIRELNALVKNDYVVHIDHGIGLYQGLEKISVGQSERECLTLLYQEGDKIYVPIERMERVQKYSGKDCTAPSLSKLGSQKWENIKARTRKAVQQIAEELIKLYSVRENISGYAFGKDTAWQMEMEESFLYDETKDQMEAIREIKRDMEASKPMDRLICGDVGFGKTEVAMRAAFKAVNDNKQVAVLVPTTVLAQQHLETFRERLKGFPVRIESLSRFHTKREQNEIVSDMVLGKVDIVIGTHRLLSKDEQFKNLGLLIIDEEHRFGVKHKEKLKHIKHNVDVLALSATPIPRTLHFAMMKIRDMSLITTPPRDRLPIITEVTPFDELVVVEAIQRELARGGQVFFVHNRVKSIYAVSRMIEKLIPGIRLGVAHGQMEARELEKVMLDFLHGKFDCLVATMIIESGIDMPHVNTLIIHRADRLGLAQLYQLRGRVGRSDRRAYAYLLTPPFQSLSPEAIKRLRTIEEFTELGAGFQIAMRDLEIRGAGNLLGMQQSGYIDAVGFDLYQKLVNEAVEELTLLSAEEKDELPAIECQVMVEEDAFIPDSYIQEESMRVNLYRQLSQLRSEDEIQSFQEELRDRFGPLPVQVIYLIKVTELRSIAESRGIHRVVIESNSIKFFFDEVWMNHYESSELFTQRLRSMIDNSPVPIRFLQQKAFGIRAQYRTEDPFELAKKILHRWG